MDHANQFVDIHSVEGPFKINGYCYSAYWGRFALNPWMICSVMLMSAVVVEWPFLNPCCMAGRLDSATSAGKIILSVRRATGDMILTGL